ncbi:MAG: hypothetical protein MET45_24710 [Nostoc sp. LLA-1]|nr:hypothetical protein [Cyanocohniella sp. LLY]
MMATQAEAELEAAFVVKTYQIKKFSNHRVETNPQFHGIKLLSTDDI